MLPTKSTDPFNDLQNCVAKLDTNEAVAAVCIGQSMLTVENQAFFARALNAWGMSLQGAPGPFGVLFINRNNLRANVNK